MTDLSLQAWSAVWRLPTTLGPVVVKQTTAERAAEIAVHAACARLAPDYVDPPLATDTAGHRLLLPDGGPTLDERHPITPPPVIADVVGDYAGLQRVTAEHRSDLLAAGCPTWDPATAADELESLATALAGLPASDLRHLTAAQRDALLDNREAYRRAGAALAGSALPPCLDHGDLWPGNVLAPAPGGRHRFIDFGDAAWTHPFLSLQPLLRHCHRQWVPAGAGFDLDDVRLAPVVAVYLRAWADIVAPADASTLLADAALLSPLRRCRALLANFAHAGSNDADDLGPTPWQWLTGR